MICFIGIDRYIVYAPEGAGRHALDVAHTLTWLRAVLCSALVLALAEPTAALVGAGGYADGFAVVAIVPLLRERHASWHNANATFRPVLPGAAAEAIGAVLGLLASAAAAVLTHDYQAVLWGWVFRPRRRCC